MLLGRVAVSVAIHQARRYAMPVSATAFYSNLCRFPGSMGSHAISEHFPQAPIGLRRNALDETEYFRYERDVVSAPAAGTLEVSSGFSQNDDEKEKAPKKKTKLTWEDKFALLRAFKRATGHCRVPPNYVFGGVKLGGWVETQRKEFKKHRMGMFSPIINEKRIAKLDQIGMAWEEHHVVCNEDTSFHHKFGPSAFFSSNNVGSEGFSFCFST